MRNDWFGNLFEAVHVQSSQWSPKTLTGQTQVQPLKSPSSTQIRDANKNRHNYALRFASEKIHSKTVRVYATF